MLRPRKTIDAVATGARLDDLGTGIEREAEGADADPFDDAMLSAVFGLIELSKAQAKALEGVQARLNKIAREV